MFKKIFFISIIISLFISMFSFRHYFNIFYFQKDINKIAINIETNKEDEIYVCFNKNCDKPEYNNGIYSYKLNNSKPILYEGVVDNIEIIADSKLEYSAISLFVSGKFYYFNQDEIVQKEIDFNSKKAYSINIPFENNDKNFLQKACIYFESIFYNWYFYIFFYVLTIIYVIKYKPKIKVGIYLILLLAFLLRLSHIDFISLWNDELYSFCHISDMGRGFNFKNIFLDPGNPPLFFLISNIWLYFFNKTVLLIRFLPVIIGVFCVWSIYYVVNNLLNKKTALISAFLCAINVFIILESNEIRSYILSMTLILWSMLFFFKLKTQFSTKNLILYTIISIALINTHYYCLLYAIFNFIFGIFLFKKEKIKFLTSNVFAFITFIPYFLISNKIALSNEFNMWIEKPTFITLYNHIIFYFGNFLFLILSIIFCALIYKKLRKKEKEIFIYIVFSITFVFMSAYLISIFIKPILFERYFCIFLPYLIINTAIFLSLRLNTVILFLVFIFSINMPKYENYNLFANINFALRYAALNSKNYQKYNVFYVVPDNISYIKYFPNIEKEKVIVLNCDANEKTDLLKFYLSKIDNSKKTVLYLPEMCLNFKIINSETLDIKRIETTFVPIYKIVLK